MSFFHVVSEFIEISLHFKKKNILSVLNKFYWSYDSIHPVALKWEKGPRRRKAYSFFSFRTSAPKPSLKIGTANAICWLRSCFFRNKTFLFSKIES